MNFNLVIPAFFAGILTFLAPCTLPLVPGYLALISGTNLDDPNAKRKVFLNGLAFVLGFSLVFIILGTLIGIIGQALTPYRVWLTRIAGLFVIIFGFFILNIIKIPFLAKETGGLKAPAPFARGKPLTSLALGAAFATGWTPCVGPILASILLLASTATTVWQGTLLLFVFSVGLAIPFLLIAFGIGRAAALIARLSAILNYVSIVGGVFLIGLGLLLLTNNMALLIAKGYQLLQFINYDRIVNFL